MEKKLIVNCVTLSRVNESFIIIQKQYVKKKKTGVLLFIFHNLILVFTILYVIPTVGPLL